MLQPWFLDIDHTMRLHRSLIETYGGSEGIRDVGLDLIVEEEALVDLVLQVACGAVGKQEVAAFMRTHVQPNRSAEDS